MSFEETLGAHRARVDAALEAILPAEARVPVDLHRSMRYTVLAPGKRVRALLLILSGEAFGARQPPLLAAACAVEMVHACSLILDDLPCMDDASLRRGRPVNHRVFGESTALLASINLLNGAFGALADLGGGTVSASVAAEAVSVLARAIGSDGIIAGQFADLAALRAPAEAGTVQALEYIHSHKTGKLFIASAELGALLGGAKGGDREAVVRYAKNLGLAFQITDDVLDARSDAETLGKDVRQDKGRTTFATLCGVAGARRLADELTDHAVAALTPLGRRAASLRDLAEGIRTRGH